LFFPVNTTHQSPPDSATPYTKILSHKPVNQIGYIPISLDPIWIWLLGPRPAAAEKDNLLKDIVLFVREAKDPNAAKPGSQAANDT
jgi:hypothetical protein